MAITSTVPRGPVQVKLNFFDPPADGARPENHILPGRELARNYGDVSHDVTIQDVRGRESEYTLDKDAFQVIRGVPESAEKDFTDDKSTEANYYPEVEALLKEYIPGANRVIIFDHTIRRQGKPAHRTPVTRTHIDQTARSAAQRVRRHSPEDAEQLLQGRYRIINVWRPLNKGPVESFPLAYASSASVKDDEIVPIEHIYQDGYSGQTAGIRYSPQQQWYYLSGMTGDERLLLECFDSEGVRNPDTVLGGRLPHTAFEDPRTRADAEGRESIEVRTLVFSPN